MGRSRCVGPRRDGRRGAPARHRPRGRHGSRRGRDPAGLAGDVVDLARALPAAVLWALLGSLTLALGLAGNAFWQSRRRTALERQRTMLLEDIGLLSSALLPSMPEGLDGLDRVGGIRAGRGSGRRRRLLRRLRARRRARRRAARRRLRPWPCVRAPRRAGALHAAHAARRRAWAGRRARPRRRAAGARAAARLRDRDRRRLRPPHRRAGVCQGRSRPADRAGRCPTTARPSSPPVRSASDSASLARVPARSSRGSDRRPRDRRPRGRSVRRWAARARAGRPPARRAGGRPMRRHCSAACASSPTPCRTTRPRSCSRAEHRDEGVVRGGRALAARRSRPATTAQTSRIARRPRPGPAPRVGPWRRRTACPAAPSSAAPRRGGTAGTACASSAITTVPCTSEIFSPGAKCASAWRPSGMSSRGLTSASCASSHGIECATSAAFGSRFFGGRALSTLVMNTSSRCSPASASSSSSSLPARPTNGRPCSSSLAPGASPTIITSAGAGPSPGTKFVHVSHGSKPHGRWVRMSRAMSSSVISRPGAARPPSG